MYNSIWVTMYFGLQRPFSGNKYIYLDNYFLPPNYVIFISNKITDDLWSTIFSWFYNMFSITQKGFF